LLEEVEGSDRSSILRGRCDVRRRRIGGTFWKSSNKSRYSLENP